MKFKASILRYADSSISTLMEIKSWLRLDRVGRCDVNTFAASSLRVATATGPTGKVICHNLIETVLMIAGFAVSPKASVEDARLAGDSIDRAVAELGQSQGISKLVMICPADIPLEENDTLHELKNVRVFEQVIPQNTIIQGMGLTANQPKPIYFN